MVVHEHRRTNVYGEHQHVPLSDAGQPYLIGDLRRDIDDHVSAVADTTR